MLQILLLRQFLCLVGLARLLSLLSQRGIDRLTASLARQGVVVG